MKNIVKDNEKISLSVLNILTATKPLIDLVIQEQQAYHLFHEASQKVPKLLGRVVTRF